MAVKYTPKTKTYLRLLLRSWVHFEMTYLQATHARCCVVRMVEGLKGIADQKPMLITALAALKFKHDAETYTVTSLSHLSDTILDKQRSQECPASARHL
jgi:hypothetical protein